MTNMINMRKTTISMVKPAEKTTKKAVWLSSLDMLTTIPGHYPLFYIYRPISNTTRTDHSTLYFSTAVLKEALRKVLVDFYPVAGRFRRDHNGRLEINCNADEGVLFVEAETDAVVDDLGDFAPTLELHEALVPTVDCSGDISSFPLLAVQVTYFKCGGVSLVVHIDHHIGDGFSMFHFVNSWSKTACGLDITIQPFLDRKLLYRNPPQLLFNHIIEYPPQTKGSQQDSKSHQYGADSITSAIFKITKEQLNILKEKSVHKDGNAIKYTTFQILASHIWKCGCIARAISDDLESKLYYTVTGRNSRLTPPLPLGYFGNVVFRAIASSKVGDIKSKPIWYAANCVRKALARMDNDYLRSTIDYLELHPDMEALSFGPHLHMSPNFYIISWVGLPAHDADFGWGQPFYVGPIEIEEGSAYIFCDNANEGSLRVAIALKSLHMKVFKELFLKECK